MRRTSNLSHWRLLQISAGVISERDAWPKVAGWETYGIEQVRGLWKVLMKMKPLELSRLPELNMLPKLGHWITFKTFFTGLCWLMSLFLGRRAFRTRGSWGGQTFFVWGKGLSWIRSCATCLSLNCWDVLEDDGRPEDRIVVSVASGPTEQNELLEGIVIAPNKPTLCRKKSFASRKWSDLAGGGEWWGQGTHNILRYPSEAFPEEFSLATGARVYCVSAPEFSERRSTLEGGPPLSPFRTRLYPWPN